MSLGSLIFADMSAQPFVLILPFLSTSIPVGAPRVQLLQDEPKASGSVAAALRVVSGEHCLLPGLSQPLWEQGSRRLG